MVLLVFILLLDGVLLVVLWLLVQYCELLFFQCLWVEQQIGYVVSCCYQWVVDCDGLLMVFQFLDCCVGELLCCGKDFLCQLVFMDEVIFRLLQQCLVVQNCVSRLLEVWVLFVLCQEYGLLELMLQVVDVLCVVEVVDLVCEMICWCCCWQVLFMIGD